MKNTIIVLLLLLVYSSAFCQDGWDWKVMKATTPDLPIDQETKRITFTEVVQMDSIKKKQLYLRGKEWFVNTYKSSKDVIQMDSEDAIIGKALFKVYHRVLGTAYDSGVIKYTIKLSFKDDRYKILGNSHITNHKVNRMAII